MDKWNEQAAPNNNQKANDMSLERGAQIKGVSDEEINDMKTENEVRKQNL
ncbi:MULTISPECIES: hypothetical protein [unclassified Bacillus (in: firmicutes)]|nr:MULTISPECIES: hypothetical protein [unclassified Bacillus (in: firmicutes)]CAH0347131.1 hypothetical protein BCI9360_03505 [Bacillus sp. CECT 9360]